MKQLAKDFGLKKVRAEKDEILPDEFDAPPAFFEGSLSIGFN